MTKEEIDRRVRIAMENHCKGYNCAQSVTCAFSDLVDMDEETLFKITEGLGLGMGGMERTCGAISAAAILSGLTHSTGNLAAPQLQGGILQGLQGVYEQLQGEKRFPGLPGFKGRGYEEGAEKLQRLHRGCHDNHRGKPVFRITDSL